VKNFAVVIAAIVAITLIISLFFQFRPEGVWINCGLSEISPDFTNEMREACRQARSQNASGINK
jgi:hypothetical protein